MECTAKVGSSLEHLEMRISPIGAWPPCPARLISGALKRDALAWTVIFSLPPVALSTSETNCMMFSVWKLLAGYGVGMSHFVCAATDVAIAAKAAPVNSFSVLMGLPPVVAESCHEPRHPLVPRHPG